MPEVSVIIPTYNRTRFLSQAIKSIMDQTYSSFEVIVVEDGASRDAASCVQSFDDLRVQYVWQQHAGRSTARNLGMQVAQGRYVAFLDDDDLCLPTKLASQVAFLEKNPNVDLVGSGAYIINEESEVQGPWRPWLDVPELTLEQCLYSCPLIPSAVLLRRRSLDRLDYWFDPEMDLAEDSDFFIRLLYAGCCMAWLPDIVAAYRVHGGSSQGDGARYGRACLRILDKLFAQPDLPAWVLAEKSSLYAHYYLAGACMSYGTKQVAEAQRDLEEALALQPEIAEGILPRIVAQIAGFANTFRVTSPEEYIDFVFDHLPASLVYMASYRQEAHSASHMTRLFAAHRAGERPLLKDWLAGIWYAPRWLRNRGVWSILLRDIVGRRKHFVRSL